MAAKVCERCLMTQVNACSQTFRRALYVAGAVLRIAAVWVLRPGTSSVTIQLG